MTRVERAAGPSAHRRKRLEYAARESAAGSLRRTLGPMHLILLGVGSTVGAGIYVMTGVAAADYAGPAVLLSFMLAGVACLFTALSYAELASLMPVAGSAYTYAYVSLGEGCAWAVGWLLLLEYGISCAGVASGLSGYLVSLLHDFGVLVPQALSTTTIQVVDSTVSEAVHVGLRLDLPGAASILLVTCVLLVGVRESFRINAAIVVLKVGVLLLFVGVGVWFVRPALWTPFIPAYEGGLHYGVPGIFRAASLIFFAYVGFEAVSTAAGEARNPRRDVPLGIVGALVVCTALYMAVAAVLIGVVPWRGLGVADPLAVAVGLMGQPWLALCVKLGAVIGLCSVLLGLLYAQSRIFYTMAEDGLLSALFSHLHPRFLTPWRGTLVLGVGVALATAVLPVEMIGDLVSLGTAMAFMVVCLTVIWLRNAEPDLPRVFRVPLGGFRIRGVWIGYVPLLGVLFCLVMIVPLGADMALALYGGNPLPVALLAGYGLAGLAFYRVYGRHHSRMGRAVSGPR